MASLVPAAGWRRERGTQRRQRLGAELCRAVSWLALKMMFPACLERREDGLRDARQSDRAFGLLYLCREEVPFERFYHPQVDGLRQSLAPRRAGRESQQSPSLRDSCACLRDPGDIRGCVGEGSGRTGEQGPRTRGLVRASRQPVHLEPDFRCDI